MEKTATNHSNIGEQHVIIFWPEVRPLLLHCKDMPYIADNCWEGAVKAEVQLLLQGAAQLFLFL